MDTLTASEPCGEPEESWTGVDPDVSECSATEETLEKDPLDVTDIKLEKILFPEKAVVEDLTEPPKGLEDVGRTIEKLRSKLEKFSYVVGNFMAVTNQQLCSLHDKLHQLQRHQMRLEDAIGILPSRPLKREEINSPQNLDIADVKKTAERKKATKAARAGKSTAATSASDKSAPAASETVEDPPYQSRYGRNIRPVQRLGINS